LHPYAEKLNARLILENFEENPFLEKFYKNPEEYALEPSSSS
jgi:deoxyadenosine/deoxycytidine kinase